MIPPRSIFAWGPRLVSVNDDSRGVSVAWPRLNVENTCVAQTETPSTPTTKEMADTSDKDPMVMLFCLEASNAAQSSVSSLPEIVSVDIRKPSSESGTSQTKSGPATVNGVVEDGLAVGDDELQQKTHTKSQGILVSKVDDEEESGADRKAATIASWSPIWRGGDDDV